MSDHASILEVPVTLRVTGGTKGHPGSFNPRDGGSPPEAPEVEFRVLLTKEGREPLDITEYLEDDLVEMLHDGLIDELEVLNALEGEAPADDYDD